MTEDRNGVLDPFSPLDCSVWPFPFNDDSDQRLNLNSVLS